MSVQTAPVIDALRLPEIVVEVTQEEIDIGVASNSGHCIVAEATKKSFVKRYGRKAHFVAVDIQTIRISDCEKGARYMYLTPKRAQVALVQFDQGFKPTPFKFRLRGGQVVSLRPSKPREMKPRSDAQKLSLEKATAAQKRVRSQRKAAELHVANKGDANQSRVPTKIGGKSPPVAVLAGNRRQFGVRALGKIDGVT